MNCCEKTHHELHVSVQPAKRGYTIKQASEYLGISEWILYREMKAGQIVAKKRGASTLFDQRELDRYFDDLPEKIL